MNHTHDLDLDQQPGQIAAPRFWRSRYGIGLVIFGAIAAYFLLTEHRAHFFGALPFLLLLACPLMHVFMHHGHSGHGHRLGDNEPKASLEKSNQPGQGGSS
ncbi:MAG: DUF2933 domain-containing protein [Burkholderiaceae bacterium]|nr:DUF2933 domain-containing protein [Burkholderiaceae bacterium]